MPDDYRPIVRDEPLEEPVKGKAAAKKTASAPQPPTESPAQPAVDEESA